MTFAPILKHRIFPLPEILDLILDIGSWGMGTHVEIEFAVNMNVPDGRPKEFALLQIRPLVLGFESGEVDVEKIDPQDVLCESTRVLGNGATTDIFDIVAVDVDRFERARTQDVAREVGELNAKLVGKKHPYVLIGMGRWGSFDPWLGIPVTWDQIAGASVIVESGFRDIDVMPSQGSHFFQNITSFRVGYFTVNPAEGEGTIDWDWLRKQTPHASGRFVNHYRFEKPITVRINGRKGKGVIWKPGTG